MIETFTFRNLLTAYPKLLTAVRDCGRTAAPRGNPVIEHIQPILWHINEPQEYLLAIPGRKINIFFALAEVVWMWSGLGGAEFITYYNQNIKHFLDDGIPFFHGAYGRRVRHAGYSEKPYRETPHPMTTKDTGDGLMSVEVDQLEHVIRKIQTDPETRQAAVVIWDALKDNYVISKDHPCNNMLYFSQRGGQLNMTVIIRSNDLIWGTPYNMCQFSHLQALVAGTLDLEVGSFHVCCNNLHYYTDLYPEALDSVIGWDANVKSRRMDLGTFSTSLFSGWDMRWKLPEFDQFVGNVWMPLEKELRHMEAILPRDTEDKNASDSYLWSKATWLESRMGDAGVPAYWQHLFNVLLMYHCYKFKVPVTFNTLLRALPGELRWAVGDFCQIPTK